MFKTRSAALPPLPAALDDEDQDHCFVVCSRDPQVVLKMLTTTLAQLPLAAQWFVVKEQWTVIVEACKVLFPSRFKICMNVTSDGRIAMSFQFVDGDHALFEDIYGACVHHLRHVVRRGAKQIEWKSMSELARTECVQRIDDERVWATVCPALRNCLEDERHPDVSRLAVLTLDPTGTNCLHLLRNNMLRPVVQFLRRTPDRHQARYAMIAVANMATVLRTTIRHLAADDRGALTEAADFACCDHRFDSCSHFAKERARLLGVLDTVLRC